MSYKLKTLSIHAICWFCVASWNWSCTSFPKTKTENNHLTQKQDLSYQDKMARENQKLLYKDIWNDSVFKVDTISSSKIPKASWIVFDQKGKFEAGFENAKELIEFFQKQTEARKEKGIFIYSKSFAIPDTPEERKWMTQYLWELYNNTEWRRSESNLIEELRSDCEKHKITLYVNLSLNLQGQWKKIAPTSN